MKKILIVGSYLFCLSSCGNNIEEQAKAKNKEYSKCSDQIQKLFDKQIEATKNSADATDFLYRLQIAGAEENHPSCIKAKKEADKFQREADSLKKEAEELKKTKCDVLMRELDSLNKLLK